MMSVDEERQSARRRPVVGGAAWSVVLCDLGPITVAMAAQYLSWLAPLKYRS